MSVTKLIKKVAPWVVYALVAAFIVLTLKDNYEEIKQYEISNGWLLIPAVLAFAAQFAVNSLIWSRLMTMAGEKVPIWNSVYVYVSSFIVRYIPGNVWAIAARATMNRKEGVPVMSSIWGWVIENVSYLLVGLLFSVLVILNVDVLPKEIIVVVAVAIPACFLFLLRYDVLEKLVRVVAEKRFPDQVKEEVEKFIIPISDRFLLLGMFTVSWLLFSVQFHLVADAVSSVSVTDFFLLAGVNALAWSIGYISLVTPSGTGIREGVMILALPVLGIAGEIDALVIAFAARITAILGEVLYFVLIRGLNLMRNGNGKKAKSGGRKQKSR